MKTEIPFNATVKNCRTCAHCQTNSYGATFDYCSRLGCYADRGAANLCQMNLWQPKPRPRSFRRWIWETFFA